MCKGKRRCARCGDDHEYGRCGPSVKPKCNCGGEHSVAYWRCEALKREVAVQQIRRFPMLRQFIWLARGKSVTSKGLERKTNGGIRSARSRKEDGGGE